MLGCALKRGEGCFVVYCASKTNSRAAVVFSFWGVSVWAVVAHVACVADDGVAGVVADSVWSVCC